VAVATSKKEMLEVKTDQEMQAIGKVIRNVVSIIFVEASPAGSQYSQVILLRDRDGGEICLGGGVMRSLTGV
jgi:hypothetical protein